MKKKRILLRLLLFSLIFNITETFSASTELVQLGEGDDSCNSAYQEINGLVVIEAENLTLTNGWVRQTAVSGFTGTGYIQWTGTQFTSSPGNGLISTKIQINSPGVYRFQMRSRVGFGTSGSEHNDTWIRFPDASDYFALQGDSKIYPKGSGKTPNPNGAGSGGWFKVFMNSVNNWSWNTFTSDNDAHDIYVQFDAPGEYTFEISARSSFHNIDRFVLHKGVTSPLSLSNQETTCGTVVDPVAVSGISVSPTNVTLQVGSTQQILASISPANATNKTVFWSSSNAAVASVSSTGLVTANAVGEASITARSQDGNFTVNTIFTVVQNSQNQGVVGFVLVNAENNQDFLTLTNGVQISSTQIQGLSLNIRANTNPSVVGSVRLTLSGPINAARTENGAPYTLFGDANGNYNGVPFPNGSYTLSATPYSAANLGGTAGQTSTIQFSVVNQTTVSVSGISVSPSNASISVGGTVQISASISPTNASNKNVIWTSSDSNVANVDQNGLVTGLASGSTSITATSQDGGFSAVAAISVTQGNSALGIDGFTLVNAANNGDILEITNGIQLPLSQFGDLNLNIRANPIQNEVGSVRLVLSGPVNAARTENGAPYSLFGDANGNYNGRILPIGLYTLSATAYSGSNLSGNAGTTLSIQFSIVENPTIAVTGISVSPAATTLEIGQSQQISAEVFPFNATNKTLVWSSSNSAVASVNPATGLVSGISEGNADISATTQDGGFVAVSQVNVVAPVPNLGIVDFALVNSQSNSDVLTLTDGLLVNANQVAGLSLNVRANTNPQIVGSVFLTISGPINANRTENGAPYTLFGDSNGNYAGRSLPSGKYTVTATAYAGSNRTGTVGPTRTVSFEILAGNARMSSGSENRGETSEAGYSMNQPDISLPDNGLLEAGPSDQLLMYPNPIRNQVLTIMDKSWKSGEVVCSLYNSSGVRVLRNTYKIDGDQTIKIDLEKDNLKQGVYQVVIESSEYLSPKRLLLLVK